MPRHQSPHAVDPVLARSLLAGPRIAVVGASGEADNFGGTIYRELRQHGIDAVAVHPSANTLDGDPCHPTLADVPMPVDAAIVMVPAPESMAIVQECAALGIGKVWLFKGVGGTGAASDEAVDAAIELGLDVVPGACPLMFLEPVGWFHRIHRAVRHANGSLASAT